MFAYCNNNPVNYCDSSGASPVSYCNGDRNPLFIGYYGCGGGGGGGGSSQYEDIFEELDAIKDKTLDTVGSVAEYCWDAYMWSQNVQQEAQLQQAIAINDVIADRFSTPQKTGNTLALAGSGILLGTSIDAIVKAAAAGSALGGPIGGAIGSLLVFGASICFIIAEE